VIVLCIVKVLSKEKKKKKCTLLWIKSCSSSDHDLSRRWADDETRDESKLKGKSVAAGPSKKKNLLRPCLYVPVLSCSTLLLLLLLLPLYSVRFFFQISLKLPLWPARQHRKWVIGENENVTSSFSPK